MSARLALELLGRHGVLPGERALLVGGGEEVIAAAAALREVGAGVVGPIRTDALRSIGGRGRVAWARWVEAGGGLAGEGASGRASLRRERVEVVIFGDRTPNLDLVLAAGGTVGWRDGRLGPDVGPDGLTSVRGLFVAGDAAGRSADTADMEALARAAGAAAASYARTANAAMAGAQTGPGTLRAGDPPRSATVGRPPNAASTDAVLCFCEDVRGWEVRAELVAGYTDPELVKRRTGALTGPCQGKYCLSAVSCAIGGGEGDAAPDDIHLPTGRPPLRPVRLRDLIAEETPITTADAGHPAADTAAAEHR